MPNGFEYDDIGLRNESVGGEQGSAGEHTVCRRPVLRDDNIVLDRKLVCRKRVSAATGKFELFDAVLKCNVLYGIERDLAVDMHRHVTPGDKDPVR